MNVNKKLWSFIFGCLIAASFVWLISLGKSAGVIEYFHQYPEFVIDYYALMITAIATACLTFFTSKLMVVSMLSTAIPALIILVAIAVIGRLMSISRLKNQTI